MLLAGHLTLWIWNVKVWNLTKTFLFENQDLWFQTLPQSPDEKWIQFDDGHDQRYSMANTIFQEILRFSKKPFIVFSSCLRSSAKRITELPKIAFRQK